MKGIEMKAYSEEFVEVVNRFWDKLSLFVGSSVANVEEGAEVGAALCVLSEHSSVYGSCYEKYCNHVLPKIVCLCGSTRFVDEFAMHNIEETLKGNIVLTVGCGSTSAVALLMPVKAKEKLDELHKRKIDLCDEVLVLNVGGYIGTSTASEIAYAESLGKVVRYVEANSQ